MDHFAWIDIPLEATALAITRLIENDLVKPPADFDLERVKQANAYLDHNIVIALIEEALLTEYFAFEVLLSFLALRLSYGNGNTCHCGMDGKLIPNNDRIPRISFNIMEGDAFWFKELCGYRHYPSIPLKWLEKKINLSEWNNYEASIFDELKGSVPDGSSGNTACLRKIAAHCVMKQAMQSFWTAFP